MPISVLVLALLAVPLSRSSPREGRYGRLGIGLLCYLIYTNMLAIARLQVEQESVPDWVGVWWVHAVALAVAALLLLRQSGVLVRSPVVAAEVAP
jgi:lipopolysaccharide export system permease protein